MANLLCGEETLEALKISSWETARQDQRVRDKKFQLSLRNKRWSLSANSGCSTASIRPSANLAATCLRDADKRSMDWYAGAGVSWSSIAPIGDEGNTIAEVDAAPC
jgi:hypothetical protein